MALSLDEAFCFVGQHNRGVMVTRRANGRPQLSNILYVPGADARGTHIGHRHRAKTRNLRRDPLASLHVTQDDFFAYVVIDGRASLSPVARDGHDAVVEELVETYRLGPGRSPRLGGIPPSHGGSGQSGGHPDAESAYGMVGN